MKTFIIWIRENIMYSVFSCLSNQCMELNIHMEETNQVSKKCHDLLSWQNKLLKRKPFYKNLFFHV